MLLLLIGCVLPPMDLATATDSAAPESPPALDSGAPDSGDDAPAFLPSAGITGPDNSGDIEPTVRIALAEAPTQLAAADLDGDGQDEILAMVDGALTILRVNADDGTSTTQALPTLTGRYAYALGNGQVLLTGRSDAELLTFTLGSDGSWAWTTTAVALAPANAMPVGDLDGDGTADVALSLDEELRIVRGPFAADLPDEDILLQMTGWGGYGDPPDACQGVASGDLDQDGADDLVWYNGTGGHAGVVQIRFGPFPWALEATGDQLSDVTVVAYYYDDPCGFGLVDDLDGDGMRELAITPGKDLILIEPDRDLAISYQHDREIAATGFRRMPPGVTPILAGAGDEVGWWYAAPPQGRIRPDASTPADADVPGTFGRFGSAQPIDYAWVSGTEVHVVPGWGGRTGPDVDRDGVATPEDCDDADPARHPGAEEVVDGVDQDCDGAPDDYTGVPLLATFLGGIGEAVGESMVVWPDPRGDRVAWISTTWNGPAIWAPLTGERALLGLQLDTLSLLGDYDGDGQPDLVGGEYGYGWSVVLGPAEAGGEVLGAPSLGQPFTGLASLGDLDEDGLDDVLAHSEYLVYEEPWLTIYGYEDALSFGHGDGSAPALDLRFARDPTRRAGIGPADLNADGHADLFERAEDTARAWTGPFARDVDLDGREPDIGFVDVPDRDDAIRVVAVDGGTLDDLLVRGLAADTIDLALGPWSAGYVDLASEIDITWTGPTGSDFGAATLVVNGWLFVGAPDADGGTGAVWGFRLDPLVDGDWSAADLELIGPVAGGGFGAGLAVGDYDGDGVEELFVGSAGTNLLEDDGAVRVFGFPG